MAASHWYDRIWRLDLYPEGFNRRITHYYERRASNFGQGRVITLEIRLICY
ncbi:MAG: hypothetical protein OXG21_00130 [Rhodobacteraceae bacterium]|nr:hypothetical protein [Paracoccaceae bacterium]